MGGEVIVMQQWAANGAAEAAVSGTAWRGSDGARGGAAGEGGAEPGVRLTLPGVVGLLVIRADPARVALADALSSTLGLALPERLSSVVEGGLCLRWMSPDEWLLSCPPERAFDIETRLRQALQGSFSITDVSGGYAVLQLEGRAVRELLAGSTSLDVDPRVFAAGRVANTVFAKTTATLRNVADAKVANGAGGGGPGRDGVDDARSGGPSHGGGDGGGDGGRYELICRRSFADYVVRWIVDGARAHGLLVLEGEPHRG